MKPAANAEAGRNLHENHIGFWEWDSGQVVYRMLKARYAKRTDSVAEKPRLRRMTLVLEIGLFVFGAVAYAVARSASAAT